MKLLTQEQIAKMIDNGKFENREKDHYPVVKLFMPGTGCTWLLVDLDPEYPHIAYGLCDLGMGFPELGSVDLNELSSVKNRFGLGVERDLYFKAKFPLSVYANAARNCEQITEVYTILSQFS